jgi:hypothetical protein
MINRIMTPRAAAVALAASALIAAPALAVEGNSQNYELRGGTQAPQIAARSGDTQTNRTTSHYNGGGRNYGGGNGYNVRTDRHGNPIIRCSSGDYRTEYCAAPHGYRIRDVRIVNRRSSASCDYGSDWGYDRNSVWVTDGCRADFALLNTRGNDHHARDRNAGNGSNSGYGNDNGYNRQASRRERREARRSCEYVLTRRADMGGWQHAEFIGRPRVETTGHYTMKVYGSVHLTDGYTEKRQDVSCTVRNGTVRYFTDLYSAGYGNNGHNGRNGRHGRRGYGS